MNVNPMVVDLSHHNTVQAGGFGDVYKAGIRGVIHKATQGTGVVDITYQGRRPLAKVAGLLWGAYHFADSSNVEMQVDHFLKEANPDKDTLIALDYEENGSRTMSIDQARQFLQLIIIKTGRKAVLYSGNLIKETLPKHDEFFATHRLWLAQYGPQPRTPPSWAAPWLWQYTGDGVGQPPHNIPGIVDRGLDINHYWGTADQLAQEWAS